MPDHTIAFGGNAWSRTLSVVVIAATPLVLLVVVLLAWKLFGPPGGLRKWRERRRLDRMLRGAR